MGYILPIAITVICSVLYSLIRVIYSLIRDLSSRRVQRLKIPEKWWNPNDEKVTTNIESFNISFSGEFIEDLQTRLKNTRKDGKCDTIKMQALLDYWATSYNFQRRETYINKFNHYITNIQGLDIHYVHVKPKLYRKKQIFPLLMLHGWPSSIIEFYKIIPLLTCSRHEYKFVFEVIVPSIPGFGFSSAPTVLGLSCIDLSVILKNLMLRLGHNKFYIQGSDWGIFISRIMSSLFPEHVMRTHSNVCALSDKRRNVSNSYLTEINKRVMLSKKLLADTKYFQIHAMTSETTGVGLNDSPAALATYIIEKFFIATKYSEINDIFLKTYSYDDLIDNIMIYWKSKSITTAMRIYAEQLTKSKSEPFEQLIINSEKVNVPSHFSCVLSKIPKLSVLKTKLQKEILLATYAEPNGRFPAFEEPKLFAENIWEIINKWNKHNK